MHPTKYISNPGSSSFITDAAGLAEQHIQYLPFGELFVSQRNTSFDSRYKFTAKELDNETNYTYFGARYYDSDLSVWLSVDPLSDKYPSLSPYAYCANNPVILVDPDGMQIGDFYDRMGNYLGNDGKSDGKIYLLNEGYRARTENKSVNWGGELSQNHSEQLKNASTEVGGLIIQNRYEEGDDYTISVFTTAGNEEPVSGYMLEPAGPSTKAPNQDQRIPEGVYDLENYTSKKFSDNFIIFNNDVPKSRKILYHAGNNGSHTSGCNLPGTTYNGNGTISGSLPKMNEIRSFIKEKGAGNVRVIINNKIPAKPVIFYKEKHV